MTDCFLLCFSVISKSSFENVLHKWYPELNRYNPNASVILVGLKSDMRDNRETLNYLRERGESPVTFDEGVARAKQISAVKYVECSARTQKGLKNVFDEAIRSTWQQQVDKKKKKKHTGCSIM
jgi:Ras-related C3 botulinum toxin substrate 1